MSGRVEQSGTADVRSTWRAVALPSEHGGWGLTLEPVVLGLVAVWSWPGLGLGAIALLAFLARTPLKVVLVDRHRDRSLARTRLARRVLLAEVTAIAILVAVVASAVPATTWVPFVLAAPLVAIELWFEARSRGRRLAPELAGAIGIGSTAAAIVVAGGEGAAIAAGAWCVVAARVIASIPFVRVLVQRLHGRSVPSWRSDAAQLSAVGLIVAAWVVGWAPPIAIAAISVLAFVQLVGIRRDPPDVRVIGISQTLLGLAVAVVAGLGLRSL